MARVKKKRRPRDPEGRMSLGEHLLELRNRLGISALAILLGAIGGWFLFPWVFEALQQPFENAKALGLRATINYGGIGSPLNTRLQMAAYVGMIISSPVVLFQIWRFITPGLHKHERRYAYAFFGSAIPLFFVGCAAGYWIVNKAVPLLLEFTPQGDTVSNVIDYAGYLSLLVKTILAFGIAFTMPVFLVVFNFMGILPGRAMLKAWRWVTLLCFVFTAVMVPTPDPFTMTFMALPMVGLYFTAVIIGLIHDRRVAQRAGIDEEDVDRPSDIGEVEKIPAPSRIETDTQ